MGLLDPPALTPKSAAATYVTGGNRIPVCERVYPPYFNPGSLSDGTKQGVAWRSKYPVMNSGHSLKISYSNFQNTSSKGEDDGPNAVTLYAAIESASGAVPIPITPVGGVLIQPGETKTFDVGMSVKAGDILWVRTQLSVATLGQKWSYGNPLIWPGEGVLDTSASPTVDITKSALTTDFVYTGGYPWGPSAITAVHEGARLPSVLVVGTSIAWGIGNTSDASKSWINQPLIAAGIPFQSFAIGGSTGAQFNALEKRYRRMILSYGLRHTHAIWEHWVNDRANGFAANQTMSITGWRILSDIGMKVWGSTGIVTTNAANTVTDAANANRISYNTWMRDGAPLNPTTFAAVATGTAGSSTVVRFGQAGHPAVGYFEVADIAESARVLEVGIHHRWRAPDHGGA